MGVVILLVWMILPTVKTKVQQQRGHPTPMWQFRDSGCNAKEKGVDTSVQ